jgi:hypothetical protein
LPESLKLLNGPTSSKTDSRNDPPNGFSRVLSGDTSNIAEGHEIADQRISNACSRYEAPPAFYSADAESFGGIDPAKVPLWMHTAAQISIGARSAILEDGADTCNSESDSDNEDHGEALKGMYTPEVPLDSKGPTDPLKVQAHPHSKRDHQIGSGIESPLSFPILLGLHVHVRFRK